MTTFFGLDIGSNSVGSAWIDAEAGTITAGVSVFPAGVDESDDKRGEPKNAKRRMVRRTRITLARRAQRKRELRLRLIEVGLLPPTEAAFRALVDGTDPWELRRRGLDEALTPHAFGRVLLHLSQRRGALGLKLPVPDDVDAKDAAATEDGKVKDAVQKVRAKMTEANARTFGEFIAVQRADRVTTIESKDRRPADKRKGDRVYRGPVRNKAGNYEHCADRPMIRDEFAKLWDAQRRFGGPTAALLTDALRIELDDERGDDTWRHKGLLFGQRRQSWDLGTLGRCTLEPTERCVPHADRHASLYRVVETVNNLKVIEGTAEARPLTPDERAKLLAYLRGPLGMEQPPKKKGVKPPLRPKTRATVSDLRKQMGWSARTSKTDARRFNIETDADRTINTDWFNREIVHGAIGTKAWDAMGESLREGINRAVLKFDPDEDTDPGKLRDGLTSWGTLDESQADALVAAWKRRPRPDNSQKRLKISRRAVRNLLVLMNRPEPWDDPKRPGQRRWLTEIEARKLIAEDAEFMDATTGQPLDDRARPRYATGAKGATARDRYYMRKHILRDRNGEPILGPDNKPLAEPPPAPMISNPVVRKAIHEVRRHLVAYMTRFGRKPDEVYIELAREAKMGAKDSDALLLKNRLRERIRKDIIDRLSLGTHTTTQQRAAVDRVVLAAQQGGVCPLCGNQAVPQKLTPDLAASGEGCEVAHILPRASGGHNGLGNLVLAHTKCNRDMARRTPREFWNATLPGGFDEGMRWVEGIYGDIQRPKPSEVKNATGCPLWKCFFAGGPRRRGLSYDHRKIEQFKKNISDADVQSMTERQAAATKYASRQVMAYLADALYDGKGLPERSTGQDDKRHIFASNGMWTWRLRREWGLFFDPHGFKSHNIDDAETQQRKEKDRGDHRHHAIDAILIALSSAQVRNQWEQREKDADQHGINIASQEAMDDYRRANRLPAPAPFGDVETFRQRVRDAVYGTPDQPKPVCHRPVKRKLIGALHEESLRGPVLDADGQPTGHYTRRKSVLDLTANHLREPVEESEKQAVQRLAKRRQKSHGLDARAAKKWAKQIVQAPGYTPAKVDPSPGKSGIVRDIGLRRVLRDCLEAHGLDPDHFKANDLKKLCPANDPDGWKLRMPSGVPIKTVVLLCTMSDPVLIRRKRPDYATGDMAYDPNPNATRAYVGGNNHHVEVRVNDQKKGKAKWTGQVVTAFDAAQRKLARLRAFKAAGIPKPKAFTKLSPAERKKLHPVISKIERDHPLVDRSDNDDKGGRFVMSLCEGEMVWMRPKPGRGLPDEPAYFVVAKLNRQGSACSIVMVPHWDARAATERKNASGEKVPNSKRLDFVITPTDLHTLAPPDHEHAVKVIADPLGQVHPRPHD